MTPSCGASSPALRSLSNVSSDLIGANLVSMSALMPDGTRSTVFDDDLKALAGSHC